MRRHDGAKGLTGAGLKGRGGADDKASQLWRLEYGDENELRDNERRAFESARLAHPRSDIRPVLARPRVADGHPEDVARGVSASEFLSALKAESDGGDWAARDGISTAPGVQNGLTCTGSAAFSGMETRAPSLPKHLQEFARQFNAQQEAASRVPRSVPGCFLSFSEDQTRMMQGLPVLLHTCPDDEL